MRDRRERGEPQQGPPATGPVVIGRINGVGNVGHGRLALQGIAGSANALVRANPGAYERGVPWSGLQNGGDMSSETRTRMVTRGGSSARRSFGGGSSGSE